MDKKLGVYLGLERGMKAAADIGGEGEKKERRILGLQRGGRQLQKSNDMMREENIKSTCTWGAKSNRTSWKCIYCKYKSRYQCKDPALLIAEA